MNQKFQIHSQCHAPPKGLRRLRDAFFVSFSGFDVSAAARQSASLVTRDGAACRRNSEGWSGKKSFRDAARQLACLVTRDGAAR
jgi:hypothetical protein